MVNDYLQLRERALADDFITELPSFLAAKYIKEGRLVEILPDHPFPRSPLHLVYRRLRYPVPIIQAYVEHCTNNLAHLLENWDTTCGEPEQQ
ncbi:LysR substrate binding domain protein [compost metagenome]